MKTHSLLSSRALTLGLAALLLPAAHAARAAEPANPAVGALTLEAPPAARVFALPALTSAAVGPGAPGPNAAPTPTPAPNLVTNPGFETGDTTGYTKSATHGALLAAETYTPHTGTYELYFGTASGSDGSYVTQETVTQSVPTTSGRNYLVSFYLNDRGASPSNYGGTFDVTFGGATVLTTSGLSNTNGYVLYSATVPATAATSDLTFSYFNGGQIVLLDDLSVTALPVPEPATWAGGALLLGTGVVILRRRRAAARA